MTRAEARKWVEDLADLYENAPGTLSAFLRQALENPPSTDARRVYGFALARVQEVQLKIAALDAQREQYRAKALRLGDGSEARNLERMAKEKDEQADSLIQTLHMRLFDRRYG